MIIPKIRASERVSFQRCQQAWWWRHREGLVRKGKPADALWFGTGVHIAFAKWYCGPGKRRGPEPAETWDEYARNMEMAYVRTNDPDDEQVAKYVDARELGVTMLEGYRALYGKDEDWLVISPERTFHLNIPWPDNAKNFWDAASVDPSLAMAVLVGTYDLVYESARTGRFWLGEHKTAKSIQTRHLAMDNQAGTYWATATAELLREGLLPRGEVLAGIMYNFLRKGMPDERPKDAEGYATNKPVKADYIAAINAERAKMPNRTGGSWLGPEPTGKETLAELQMIASKMEIIVLGERSKVQSPPLFQRTEVHRTRPERRSQLLRVQQDALQMELLRDGLLTPTKSATRECSWCEFYDMCELQERGGDWESLRDTAYAVQDPYADHRKSTDE